MKSNNRWIHQQASPPIPHSSNYSYFTEQARRAGYVRDHQHHLHLHPQSRPSLPPYPHDMHEAIQREIEKERIREEIIMSEVVRRRVLEAEVRRELMMEREMVLRRGDDGLPFGGPPPVMGFDSQTRLSLLGTEKLNVRRDNGGFETLPFQRGIAELRVSEVKPVPEGGKEKEKIILLAKPDGGISGSKRKAVTPPPPPACEIPSDLIILRKKAKEEWSCALCQVSATCQRGLDEHLQGKKHKSKEAALKAQKAGKNYSIGLFPKKTDKLVTTVDPGTEDESMSSKKSEQGENPNSEKNQSKGDVNKKKKNRFWCEMCQVGAHSMKVMNAHKRGKKHVSRLERTNRNNESGPSDQKEKIEDGENKTSKDCDEARSDHEPIETVEKKPEDHEPADEAEPEDREPLDGTELADREPVDETKPDVADELTVVELSRHGSQSNNLNVE